MTTDDKKELAVDYFWELVGPDGFGNPTKFKDIENPINYILTEDHEALGKWVLSFARPALVDCINSHDSELRAALSDLGVDVDTYAPLPERKEVIWSSPGVVTEGDLEGSAIR